jgi:hypothetical protein
MKLRIAPGKRVAVLGQRIATEPEVAQRTEILVTLHEAVHVGTEPAGPHVDAAGARVDRRMEKTNGWVRTCRLGPDL